MAVRAQEETQMDLLAMAMTHPRAGLGVALAILAADMEDQIDLLLFAEALLVELDHLGGLEDLLADQAVDPLGAVSYTHLTLPTIYSV